MSVYSIDIDGCITYDTSWDAEQCLSAKPRPDVIAKINELYKSNFIVMHTARRWDLCLPTVQWLRKNGVNFHAICCDKMPADFIFDTDAINDLDKL